MSLTTETVSPKATALAPLPTEDPLTPVQWKTLLAIADAVIPAIKPISNANAATELPTKDNDYSAALSTIQGLTPSNDAEAVAKAYLADSAAANPVFKLELQRIFALYLPVSTRSQLLMVLNILNTRAGSLFLTGYITPLGDQPPQIRESILQGWATARLPLLRQLFRSLTMLTKLTWLKTSPTINAVLGVPRVPTGMFPPGDTPETIETDVIVVGSGCGGGVSAKNLAEAGHRVIVTEKSYHWTPDHYPMTEKDGWTHLFMDGAFITSDDSSVTIVAGSSWGGGGTVNWSASLQTQAFVRKEWASRGLPFFTSAEFQDSLDRVCTRMGVSTEYIEQNRTNQILLEGARKLGYTHKAVPQNTGGKRHYCGHCSFGCGSCEKQGPVVSFLPDAARAGAQFIEGFNAEKILFTTKNGEKVATGVQGTWTSRDIHGGVANEPLIRRKVIIKAKRIIVSAGTMQSPLLLLRSGLKNYHIGRNLHIHPVSVLGAIHPEPTNPWDGAILTSVVTEYENLDNAGHGAKLEATNMIPSSWLTLLNWTSGLDYKVQAARMKYMAGYISLARDRDTGRVYPDPTDGRVRLAYTPSSYDKKHIITGLVALAKIQYITGATEIFTTLPSLPPFKRDTAAPASSGINDPAFQTWLSKLESTGLPSPDSGFVSAHQMGTCRMSKDQADGVVDPEGRVWGTRGLYVADASVFPSASGVNPMLLAHMRRNIRIKHVLAKFPGSHRHRPLISTHPWIFPPFERDGETRDTINI
ncbi:long-chain fatty alcohol dehydrogenase [Byssothecium circinans]|uniref:Long-chain fatty alcohol dehydrogenase n=1 Tax=Byssothecium circinans TaxID=147558 RepID=A0A6A5TIX4_9PLEO|nr:long-chain fatty alcohol dehydrogenase [Byssothecium circinans]